MKKYTLLFALILATQFLTAQVGLTVSYKQMSANNWEEIIVSQNLSLNLDRSVFKQGINFGIDFWMKPLKNYRVELLPEASYSRFLRAWTDSGSIDEVGNIAANYFNFKINTNIYLLNLEGDCDCPTFSKDGDILQKGFFIQISPGITYLQNAYTDQPFTDAEQTYKATDISYNIGLGVGVDIGFSDFITFTPFVKYTKHFDAFWENLDTNLTGDAIQNGDYNSSDLSMLEAGVRLGLRFDQ